MRTKTVEARAILVCAAMLGTAAANAALVTIEPDSFPPNSMVNSVGPGLALLTYRRSPTGYGMAQPVYASPFTWSRSYAAPTGLQVFGHDPPGDVDHWAGLMQADRCLRGVSCGIDFQVFVAVFTTKTSFVRARTTMLPWAADGAELWAYNSEGERIAECQVHGVTGTVALTGRLPRPTYGTRLAPPPTRPVVCGKVLQRVNCEPDTVGDCQYMVELHISRPTRDIAFVMWGGVSTFDTTSPIDELTYEF
jgi:hypothetical protein